MTSLSQIGRLHEEKATNAGLVGLQGFRSVVKLVRDRVRPLGSEQAAKALGAIRVGGCP